MPALSAGSRIHAGEGGDAPGSVAAPPAPPTVVESKFRLYWRRALKTGRFLWHALSWVGTILMLLYQLIYPWQWLPKWLMWLMPSPGASAWVVGLVMLGFYVTSKLPHIIGQEPGDAMGLVREVLLNQVNIVISVVFLTRVHDGMDHPPNAVGISAVLLIGFFGLLIAQLVQGIVLARRTWTDSSTGAASS